MLHTPSALMVAAGLQGCPPHVVDCRGARFGDPHGDQDKKQLFLDTTDPGSVDFVAEVDRVTFYYFLEVLWPVFMNDRIKPAGRRYAFGFAEGMENVRGFWTERKPDGKHYYCENTGVLNPHGC